MPAPKFTIFTMDKHNHPSFKPGDTIKVFTKDITSTKIHATPFEGVVIAVRGQKNNKTFTVRKIASNKVAVERIFPFDSPSIDKLKLAKATNVAFRKAVKLLTPQPDYCLVDAFYIKHFSKKRQAPVKNGDKICASIAAASIIAKVHRDSLMKRLHFKYPRYGFAKHKGYGTRFHQGAIRNWGFSKIHRMSYNIGYVTS